MFVRTVGLGGRKTYNRMTFEGEPTFQGILLNFEQLAIGTLNAIYERYIFNRKNHKPWGKRRPVCQQH